MSRTPEFTNWADSSVIDLTSSPPRVATVSPIRAPLPMPGDRTPPPLPRSPPRLRRSRRASVSPMSDEFHIYADNFSSPTVLRTARRRSPSPVPVRRIRGPSSRTVRSPRRRRASPRSRSPVPTFPSELRGVMVPVDFGSLRRSSPRSLHRASPRSPPEYVKNLKRSLRELENDLPGLPMKAPSHLPFQATKKRVIQDFLDVLRTVARSEEEEEYFRGQLIELLVRLHRNKVLTNGQFQKLRQDLR